MHDKKDKHKASTAAPTRVVFSGYLKKSPPLEQIRSGPKFLSSLLCVSGRSHQDDANPAMQNDQDEKRKKYYAPVGLKQSKRRFFQLQEFPGSSDKKSDKIYRLQYYTNDTVKEPIGEVDLSQVTTVVKNPRMNFFENEFVIGTLHKGKPRDYHLSAESESEMESWVHHLTRACGLIVEGSMGKSSTERSGSSDQLNFGISTTPGTSNRNSRRFDNGPFILNSTSLTRRGDVISNAHLQSLSLLNHSSTAAAAMTNPSATLTITRPSDSHLPISNINFRNSTPLNSPLSPFNSGGDNLWKNQGVNNGTSSLLPGNTLRQQRPASLGSKCDYANLPDVEENEPRETSNPSLKPDRRNYLYDDPSRLPVPNVPVNTQKHQYYNLEFLLEAKEPVVTNEVKEGEKDEVFLPAINRDYDDCDSLPLPQRKGKKKCSTSSEEESEETEPTPMETLSHSDMVPSNTNYVLMAPPKNTQQAPATATGAFGGMNLHVTDHSNGRINSGLSNSPYSPSSSRCADLNRLNYCVINPDATTALAGLIPDYH